MEKSSKYSIVNKWKKDLNINQKEESIIEIEYLIKNLEKEKSLKNMLILYFLNSNEYKEISKYKFDKKEQEALLIKVALSNFDKYINVLEKEKPIIFNLKLYMPKLYKWDIKTLISWLYKVEIDSVKLNNDKKKQFFYLIHQFQKETNEDKKLEIFISLLKKLQLYIKNAR